MNNNNEIKETRSNRRKKRRGLKRVLFLILIVFIVFLAVLFGNFFPQFNVYRDKIFESQAYNDASGLIGKFTSTEKANEITIEKDTIYYMGEVVTFDELDLITDQADGNYMTVIDNYATQRTWEKVYSMLDEKGFAISEEIAR